MNSMLDVQEPSLRVIRAYVRNAPQGSDVAAVSAAVFKAFAELRNPTTTHPLAYLPSQQRKRKYKASKPRQYKPKAPPEPQYITADKIAEVATDFSASNKLDSFSGATVTGNWKRLS